MSNLQEIEHQALRLSESERALLATHLLKSLPPVLIEDDDGIGEALKRDSEMDSDPAASVSLEQFKTAVLGSRKR